MVWARFDDGFPEHPKVHDLSDAAFRLFVCSVVYAGRQLTDGVVPIGVARRLPGYKRSTLIQIEEAGLWHSAGHSCPRCAQPTPTELVIHDFLDYQPSRDRVLKDREANSDRQRRYRQRQGRKQDGPPTGDDAVTGSVTSGVTNRAPARSDPTTTDPPSPPYEQRAEATQHSASQRRLNREGLESVRAMLRTPTELRPAADHESDDEIL